MTATSDQTALLNAIRANLADDAPRLIYADWLDEHGQAGRAEFIRLQCELARLPINSRWGSTPVECKHGFDSCPLCDDDPNRRSLRRREREILDANWVYWIPNTLHPVNCFNLLGRYPTNETTFTFSRGFLSHVTCRMQDWVGEVCAGGMWICIGAGCNRCNGTGRVNGHGPAIVRAECAAVQVVEFSDRTPYPGTDGKFFWVHTEASDLLGSRHTIPGILWNHKSISKRQWNKQWKRWSQTAIHFDSEAAARDALSRAAIEWSWK